MQHGPREDGRGVTNEAIRNYKQITCMDGMGLAGRKRNQVAVCKVYIFLHLSLHDERDRSQHVSARNAQKNKKKKEDKETPTFVASTDGFRRHVEWRTDQ